MTNNVDAIRCRKPTCHVSSSGACAEGHDPAESCPFFGLDPGEDNLFDDELEVDDTTAVLEDDTVKLSTGELLDVSDVDTLLRWRAATMVAIVGDQGSGKTTLICTIYDHLLRGPFAGRFFAGSRTLLGFERRSHYSRAESGLARPDTLRTSYSDGLTFFHLALARSDQIGSRIDLLLSDRAGETYRQARSQTDLIPDLVEVFKADRVVFLIDGDRIANPIERAGAMHDVRQTLRAFVDNGAVGRSSIVQVVTTKVDLFDQHVEAAEIQQRLNAFLDRLYTDFSSRLGDLTFWNIAARAPTAEFPPAFGVDGLVLSWIEDSMCIRTESAYELKSVPMRTEFDRLLARTPMEVIP